MSIEGLVEQFRWTAESDSRNDLTARYEPVQPFILKALVRRLSNVVFIDVGANVGFYAVVIGSEASVDEVHAFEPMPAGAAATRTNTTTNLPHQQVVVHQVALSDQRGQLEFAVRGPLAGDNGALRDSVLERSDFAVESVSCDRLDDVVTISGRPLVMKVDVEGHELSTFLGAATTLQDNHGFLQVEMHPSSDEEEKRALLQRWGWHLMTRVGPDHYFTNMRDYYTSRSVVADVLEEALSICLEASRTPQRASRRRIASGVYLQVSRSRVNAVKSALRALRLRRGPRDDG